MLVLLFACTGPTPSSVTEGTPTTGATPTTPGLSETPTPTLAGVSEAVVARTRLSDADADADASCIAPAFDLTGALNVTFWNSASPADDQLFHAVEAPGGFDVEAVFSLDGNGGYCSGTVDALGNLHTSVQLDEFGADSRIVDVVRAARKWDVEHIDFGVDHAFGGHSWGTMGDTSVAVGPDGLVRASYFRGYDSSLHLATRTASGWSTQRIVGEADDFPDAGEIHELAIGPDGTELVVFQGDELTDVVYNVGHVYAAVRTGGRWEITHLVDDTYDFDAPVFDPLGVAHLAYVDDDTDTLNVVTWDGAWSDPVDLGMDVEQVAAAAGPDGRVHLLVYARDDGLHWLLDAGAGGFTEQIAPVATEGDYVRDLWFAVDAEGVGHAVYIADGAVYVDQLTIP